MERQHARVLDAIFEHPFPHNLEWADVLSLMQHIGTVTERHDGKYDFETHGVHAVFTKPHDKDLTPEAVLELRRLLSDAGVAKDEESPATPEQPPIVAVLIDHRAARFFKAGPEDGRFVQVDHIEPKDPHGFRRHLEHRKEAHYKGERTPESDELFYEPIAQRLKGAPAIVLVGDAKGKSSAMHYLTAYLEDKHKDVAARIIHEERADLSKITVGDIERIAAAAGERAQP